MDTGSPISLDLDFPFPSGVPGALISSGMDHLSNNHGSFNQNGTSPTRLLSSQNRGSIDSVFDREMGWSPSHISSNRPGNAPTSSSRDDVENLHDSHLGEAGEAPSWVELKTKAGKERKRLPLACIACRRKKIKCSGEKPACKHCVRARVPCVYKVTARKAAPRTDYMAMLDKRLKRMEDRVIKMIPKEDLPDLNSTGRSSVRPPLPGQSIKKEKPAGSKRNAQEAFDAELKDWDQDRQPVKHETGMPNRTQREMENKLVIEGADALPPQIIQEHLAELFFDCVYGQSYLLLHKPSFMRKLKSGNVPPVLILAVCAVSARFSTHPQVSTEPAFMRGEQWATPARGIIEKRHFEPNVTILTSMVILGLHFFGTCEGGLSWSFGGQAMRLAYALQLHRELDLNPLGQVQAEKSAASVKESSSLPELSFTDREIRRRLMWACYLMDTFNSSGTERPSFLNEEYLQIQLPIKESRFQHEMPGLTEDLEGHVTIPEDSRMTQEEAQAEAKSNMGVAAYVMRAVVIWKKIVQYLNLGGKEKDSYQIWDPLSQFAVLQRQIAQLKSSLPSSLKYTPENLATHVSERLVNQFLFLHVVLAQDSLFLHRFAIPTAPDVHRPYPPNTPKQFLAKCATTVVESASLISSIVADSTGHTFTVPFAGYCAYASATVHVWGIFSKHPSLEATSKENLRHNYRYLTRMKRYWGMFHYMAESVKDVYRAFADAAARRKSSNQQTITKLKGEGLESITNAISAEPSRAASPVLGSSDTNTKIAGDQVQPSEGGERKSSKQMFQYGDWFDKYPHGVSETEWETSHHPHKKEAQKGAEAVMSQQSDLQSVEEFFASLSPPSKAREEEIAGQRGKKIAKKRGKSVMENIATTAKIRELTVSSGHKTARTQSQPHGHGQTQTHYPQQSAITPNKLPVDLNTSDIDIPIVDYAPHQQLQSQHGTSFDIASPGGLYQSVQPFSSTPHRTSLDFDFPVHSPSTASNPPTVGPSNGGLLPSNNLNFNFNYTSALPHLDRQMVFGAYAGFDPSMTGNSSALNNPNNLDFWNNPWDSIDGTIDMDGFAFENVNMTTPVNSGNGGASNTTRPGVTSVPRQTDTSTGNGMSSAAWFMPFNIEPPTFGNLEDFGVFDQMDTSSLPGNNDGSFSRQGGSMGGT